ncbi:hypothetical protein LX15_006257 [Streptoalloteichus tenebrarius]|uniref:Uncharacterized protein n=1 Tax=Streptoalloteichus tenebrarius (strain ATCC 17920 / DSM 40477 / JCM 4838 / CBS 697.72 / NBRC 16177 / NCIMB 11028 / NRRL B-12390 / A12253. 1 / ISP 5477) TaxID=1933 RepID=A0ABT1I428_STRSD|nr:hypothetical protein [Streptoalloteichus tenebrarius]MCP2262517.1 hypothetical protein [Streptoalloteichus tenebrarius]BFE99114.1 hypothetical protein GCM10020241_07900 [Streptoalloteichus tenebrarius]
MPASTRRQLIAVRCRYTGETHAEAAPGVGRDGTIGLDRCTPGQRRLRALLALHLLNCRPRRRSRLPAREIHHRSVWWSLNTLDVISAHYDQLVLRSSNPEVLMWPLSAWNTTYEIGLPGLRLMSRDSQGRYHLLHGPTGAVVRVDHRPPGRTGRDAEIVERLRGFHRIVGGHPELDESEQWLLGALPPVSGDAEQLLAALLVRLTSAHPEGRWAMDKVGFRDLACRADSWCSLWGHGDHWRLRWMSAVPSMVVGEALTDPVFGLAGAELAPLRPGFVVHYRQATLRLRGPEGRVWG